MREDPTALRRRRRRGRRSRAIGTRLRRLHLLAIGVNGTSLPRPGFGRSPHGNPSAMYQAVTPRATVGPIGPRPAPADASRPEAPQRRAAAATIVIGALASLATLVLV